MPRNYQITKNNPYHIANANTYRSVLYIIRDYDNLKRQREQILYGSAPPPDGMPRGNNISDPTSNRSILLATVESKIEAIDQTIFELNTKYSKTYTGEPFDAYEAFRDYGVFCYYRSKPGKELAPSTKTWSRYRSEFIYMVAKKLNYF